MIINCPKHEDFTISPNNHLRGKGCPICKASKGELLIKSILDKHSIKSDSQYTFPFYKYKYDFYLPDYDILIEFHGIRHYKYVPYFHNNKLENFKDQKDRDRNKINLAKEYKIPIIVFNYKQLKETQSEDFEKLLLDTIHKVNNRKIKRWLYLEL